jgi:DNA-binding MarR family transcriptional regulator
MILRKQDMMASLIDAFYAYSQTNEQHIRRVSKKMSLQQAYLLLHLQNVRQPRTPKQLQEYFLMSPSGMSNLLRRCEKNGWIEKTIHPTLPQSKWIVFSNQGAQEASMLYQELSISTSYMLDIFSKKQSNFLLQMVRIYIGFVRGQVLELKEADWQPIDVFIFYYYQLYFAIDWAMQTKNEVPITFKESRILQAISHLTQNSIGPTLQETAANALIGVPECSEMVHRLVQRGVLEKHQDAHDQRIVRLATTEETKRKIGLFLQRQGQWVDDRVMKPKLQELVGFFITMNKFTKYYQRNPVIVTD